MSVFGEAASQAFDRATAKARLLLKSGDRLTMSSSCGGGKQTVTFRTWVDHHGMPDPRGRWIASKTLDELAAWNVCKVNGAPVNFRDDAGIAAVEADQARFERERQFQHAVITQERRQSFHVIPGGSHDNP